MPVLLALAAATAAAALRVARSDYRSLGRLSASGLALVCAMLFVPNLMLEFATTYEAPATVVDYLGLVIGGTGLALCIAAIACFRSGAKVFCLDAGDLTTTGPYRRSRNPQYAGYFLFILGFAMNDWSTWCLVALAVAAVELHLLVLVEEEHLRRAFGEPYETFCSRVPRYAGRSMPAPPDGPRSP